MLLRRIIIFLKIKISLVGVFKHLYAVSLIFKYIACDILVWIFHLIAQVKIASRDQLLARIEAFKQRWLIRQADSLSFEIFDTRATISGSTSTEINGTFLFSQLLTDILVHLHPKVSDKDELIECCSRAYANNSAELNHILEFRNKYKAENALAYYTQPTFLYRRLNECLRTQDINLLFLFRFFIRDLQVQLAKNQCQHRIKVYRAQEMAPHERERLGNSVGQLISVNSFFSSSKSLAMTEFLYLNEEVFKHREYDHVLFEIDADPVMVSSGQRPFADISGFSAIPEEEEVLFMLGSIFRITEVCCKDLPSPAADTAIIWIFKMALCSEDQHELKAVLQDLKDEYEKPNYQCKDEVTINAFAIVLFEMHKFKLADKFFRRMLHEVPQDDHISRARCYHNIGNVALQQSRLRQSFKFYQQALNMFGENNPRAATTYLCLGNLCVRKKKYRKSMEFYNRSLALYKQQYGEEHSYVAQCYGNMGSMLIKQKKWIEARECVEHCLAIEQKRFSQIGDHPKLAYAHASLGIIYEGIGDYDRAIEHEEKALQIRLKLLPLNHELTINSYHNLIISYEAKGDIIKSAEYFTKLETIMQQQDTRTRMAFYECPRCKRYVWVYPIFRFCKGSTCFRCRYQQLSTLWTTLPRVRFFLRSSNQIQVGD